MPARIYDPSKGPYMIEDGKYVSETPTMWIFNNPRRFVRFYKRYLEAERTAKREGRARYPNILEQAMRSIWEKQLESVVKCPYCGVGPVRYFAVLRTGDLISLDGRFCSCESVMCQKQLKSEAEGTGKLDSILGLCFGAIYSHYTDEGQRKQIQGFVRKLLGINCRLDKRKAHKAIFPQTSVLEEREPTQQSFDLTA